MNKHNPISIYKKANDIIKDNQPDDSAREKICLFLAFATAAIGLAASVILAVN